MSNLATLHSPEYLAFIRKMVEDPDDDTVRLVCADWLEEHGFKDRAKYIRYSLSREHHLKWTDGETEYHESKTEWEDEADVWPRMSWPDSVYHITEGVVPNKFFLWRRGFAEAITCTFEQWRQWDMDLCQIHPIKHLNIKDDKSVRYMLGLSSRYSSRQTSPEILEKISQYLLLETRRAIGIETPVVAS